MMNTNLSTFRPHTLRVSSYGSDLVVCAVIQIVYMPLRHFKEKNWRTEHENAFLLL